MASVLGLTLGMLTARAQGLDNEQALRRGLFMAVTPPLTGAVLSRVIEDREASAAAPAPALKPGAGAGGGGGAPAGAAAGITREVQRRFDKLDQAQGELVVVIKEGFEQTHKDLAVLNSAIRGLAAGAGAAGGDPGKKQSSG